MNSDWKVTVGECSHKSHRQGDLPIEFLPDENPGLCPDCFLNDTPHPRTIADRLASLKEKEKELLFRNLWRKNPEISAHLSRKHAVTSRSQMATFGPRPEWPTKTNSSAKPSKNATKEKLPTIEIVRFSWGNNPNPEDLRRLLFDDIPKAKEDLRRSNSDYKDVQIIPTLVLERMPSRSESAWKNITDAARNWPQNPTAVRTVILPRLLYDIQRRKSEKQ